MLQRDEIASSLMPYVAKKLQMLLTQTGVKRVNVGLNKGPKLKRCRSL
jgi:hypothetical protein